MRMDTAGSRASTVPVSAMKMKMWVLVWSMVLGCVTQISGAPFPYNYPYQMPFGMQFPMANPYAGMSGQYRMPMVVNKDVAAQRRDGGKRKEADAGGPPKEGKPPVVYAPYPGEIVLKLIQNWDANLLDMTAPEFQILEGNLRSAVQAVMGPMTQVTNVYFREGYVPGNPPSRPKTVAHMMVNGGSDAASVLERAVTPDGSLGDGLKVYKDSFNAY